MTSLSKTRLSGVYRVQLSPTHFYVGRSSDIYRRKRRHLRDLVLGKHANVYMQSVWDQHHQFDLVVLMFCGDTVNAEATEQALLDSLVGTEGCVNLNRSAYHGPGMTGKKHTEETKQKIRAARSKQVFSDETRQRISLSRKGNSNAKGRRHLVTDETKRKISKSRTGVVFTEDHRNAISRAKLGKKSSNEARARQSESMRKYWDLVRQGQIHRSRTV
jgi:group I intron endonuclease